MRLIPTVWLDVWRTSSRSRRQHSLTGQTALPPSRKRHEFALEIPCKAPVKPLENKESS
jgi:hypothetical protein